MADGCGRLRIVQTGGFAGIVTLVDVDRASLDAPGEEALDEACHTLAALASSPAAAVEEGADLPSYRIEMEAADGGRQSFEIAGEHAALGSAGGLTSIVDRLAGLKRSG
jgi:hypothetical protein